MTKTGALGDPERARKAHLESTKKAKLTGRGNTYGVRMLGDFNSALMPETGTVDSRPCPCILSKLLHVLRE